HCVCWTISHSCNPSQLSFASSMQRFHPSSSIACCNEPSSFLSMHLIQTRHVSLEYSLRARSEHGLGQRTMKNFHWIWHSFGIKTFQLLSSTLSLCIVQMPM